MDAHGGEILVIVQRGIGNELRLELNVIFGDPSSWACGVAGFRGCQY